MERIFIEKTESTPLVDFDFEKGVFLLKGESYPENVSSFYGEIFEKLEVFVRESEDRDISVEIELIYFNSSSVKAIMNFLDMMEELANNGNKVTINWLYEADDETIMEFGEEFSEDLESVEFHLKEI